ncbi:efflux RND transporter periplasmic adaptor subunit [Rhizobium sp. VS19-DR104.2]|uniref:efflux RND transporter periplasmic adaptor subunit n=1 Tax=unclassified Rhizobium TaxID=2613769 RepID=UPI001C5BDF02|nr:MULTISPECIES: efflux RND transporter periplasmic adaptor subunit [unclassified Rhizobium]MBZ5763772.1 efflux RND transporter periplasmic adaptor subunit [Rhizobium sp. VS19-DR96]MBZ5769713.1 efflux RND transporter periplasmic adaptor subunit [Rhizobium sp. VS19-DR129.2]MBZ5777255.1 efflux RND transporter periplasmic adaptor subunit [Rhizobium sp. VS19-DRK62.2]MBZ5788378.1 efflux RND transporter periplasmic adaptor subunit [Rhizobium sp. VS19-DR121]MBZ5805825.1 efflux RND transporter peripla
MIDIRSKEFRASTRFRNSIFTVVIVLISLLVADSIWINRASPSIPEGVLSQQISRGAVREIVLATGKILPRAYVDVGAQASGTLKKVHFEVGDPVNAGDLLAEIDPAVQAAKVDADRAQLTELQADLVAQQAEATYAAAQLQRNIRLAPTSSISQAAYDLAVRDAKTTASKAESIGAQIAQMQSAMKSDEALLGYTKIYAPMAGTIVSIDAREGQTLNAAYSTPMVMRIADLHTMTVWAQVSEADVPQLRVGMDLSFTTLGYGERRWVGKLRQILPAPQKPDQQSGQGAIGGGAQAASNTVVLYTALFDIDNTSGDLRSEMTAQVSFITASVESAIVAPMSALMISPGENNKAQVTVIDAIGHSDLRTVSIGLRTRFEAQILNGLAPGDRVVVGHRTVKSGRSIFGLQL